MSDIYMKVGATGQFYFYHMNPITGAPVTGGVAGDYTIQLTKGTTGNQSTTGITGPTEIDASNNPGVYGVTVSGSTGFVAATGNYQVKVFLTADNSLVWNGTVRVTSDGTGAGTWGDASFTATASDGRVMSGGSPLENAIVRITDSNGVIWSQTLSDASGLYGPVYFNANGTYTIYIQKSGYTQTSGTITVSGSTATGPGTDLTITQTSAANSLLASTLMSYVRRIMLDATGDKSDTIILEVINEAAEMYSMESQNAYWLTRGVIELLAEYDTGTVTITNGSATVALSGGTFPSWAGSADLFIPELGVWFEVESRTDDTNIVLSDAYNGTTTASLTYTLVKTRYAAPTDAARLGDLLLGVNWPYSPTPVSPMQLEALKDSWQGTSDPPLVWAIEKNFICVWPPPSDYRRVNFMYYRKPTAVVSGSDTLDFPADQVFVLRRALDFIAAGRGSTVVGTLREAKQAYEEALAKAITWDKTAANQIPSQAVRGSGRAGELGWLGPVNG